VTDLLVVAVSIVALILKDAPGFSLLRLVRVFRVVRVVRRLQSLRRIVNSLASSIVPMCSAFSVLFLVTSIYAVVAVDLFGEENPVYFGSYSASLFTMFQVCTFDNWADGISRDEDGSVTFRAAVFFVSFVIIVGWVILNIVVAVLLDEFVESVTKDRNEEIEKVLAQENKQMRSLGSPLDPLLHILSTFTTSTDLSARITKIFELIDIEEVGSVSYEDFMYGLRQLSFNPPIHLSYDDFLSMVRDHDANLASGRGGVLNSAGRMEESGFEGLMREQLRHYVQRHTSQAMQGAAASGSAIGHVLFSLKLLSTTVEDINATLQRQKSVGHVLPSASASPAASVWHAGDAAAHQAHHAVRQGVWGQSSRWSDQQSPQLPGKPLRTVLRVPSPHVLASPGAHVDGTSRDVALHCKVDKILNMMTTLVSTLTPPSIAALSSAALAGVAERRTSPSVYLKPHHGAQSAHAASVSPTKGPPAAALRSPSNGALAGAGGAVEAKAPNGRAHAAALASTSVQAQAQASPALNDPQLAPNAVNAVIVVNAVNHPQLAVPAAKVLSKAKELSNRDAHGPLPVSKLSVLQGDGVARLARGAVGLDSSLQGREDGVGSLVEGAGSGGEVSQEAHEPALPKGGSDWEEAAVSSPSVLESMRSDSAAHLAAGASGGARASGRQSASNISGGTRAPSKDWKDGGGALSEGTHPSGRAAVGGQHGGAQVGGGKQQGTSNSSPVANRPVERPSVLASINRRMSFGDYDDDDDDEPPPLPEDRVEVEVRAHVRVCVCVCLCVCACVRACVHACVEREAGSIYIRLTFCVCVCVCVFVSADSAPARR